MEKMLRSVCDAGVTGSVYIPSLAVLITQPSSLLSKVRRPPLRRLAHSHIDLQTRVSLSSLASLPDTTLLEPTGHLGENQRHISACASMGIWNLSAQ